MTRPRILAVCPTAWENAAFVALADDYEILTCAEELADAIGVWQTFRFDVFRYLRGVADRFRGVGIAGVIGCGDYPGCMFSAWIADELGLPGPPARAVVLLSHKLYSREVQRRVVPEATPAYAQVGPWRKALPAIPLPLFVKPMKGTMSVRAQLVERREDFHPAVRWSAAELLVIWTVLWPYAQMLHAYGVPRSSILAFIAEAPLRGVQVTVDGFVEGGRVTVMGIVDSIMYPGTISFQRFEYPSTLPADVLARMEAITRRFVEASGLNQCCFNLEMFYDAAEDRVSIIELNPRMSYQFSDLYLHIDGKSTMEVQFALAMGRPVEWRPGAGADSAAASFVERRFSDARVVRAPGPTEIQAVHERFPSAHVEMLCAAGDRLSAHAQDVASFRLCITNLSAPDRASLFARYEEIRAMMVFEFE